MKKEIDKLAWLYIYEGKLLNARSINKTLFYLPGGKRELGESDEAALIREIKEEISIDLIPESIKYAVTFKAKADGQSEDVIVKLTCYFAEFKGRLSPAAEIEEIQFIDYENKSLCSLGSIKVMEWLKQQKLM
ncbi:NUDIX hydrolase [Psychromonas sp. L1A2]|uniref:NUDIX hydrolase n=1 Tax=Psychromonas sp. L1A2 TaxID=2686356 RepID=UPI00135B9ECB|nr:NUDIX domain-containing protein [Psychromonas sp. L1A2]